MTRYILVYLHPELGEQRFELRQGSTYRLGSRSTADIVIPQRDVSRNHALLRVEEHAFHITDLGSKNGTYVNGTPVTSTELFPGDRLQLSSAELTILEVSSGTFALAEEIGPAGRQDPEDCSDETQQYRKASEPEDLAALMEELAGAVERRGLSSLLQDVAQRFDFRAIQLFFGDDDGRLALVCSSGELPAAPGVERMLQKKLRAMKEEAGQHPCRIDRLTVADSVFLAVGLGGGYCLVLECDGNVPSTTDLRAILAAFRVAVLARRDWTRPVSSDGLRGVSPKGPLATILGESKAITVCRGLAAEFAKQDEPVLITGESGTGKELFARAIHQMSRRASGPFVPVNCAAIPPDLTEAELFGVAPGAATGVSARPGRFHAAQGGTLFLDEIGELPPALQAKLLRVLELGEVYRVGDDTPTTYDVRIISATNRKIEEAVEKGQFRADLFYRLHVLHLHIPPLRQRPGDIPILVNAFLEETSRRMNKRVAGITVRALDVLTGWRWPGNVRELRSEVIRMVAMVTSGAVIDLDQVSPDFSNGGGEAVTVRDLDGLLDLPLAEARDELERRLILRALAGCEGNQSRAAERLGISRAGLFKKMRKLGM